MVKEITLNNGYFELCFQQDKLYIIYTYGPYGMGNRNLCDGFWFLPKIKFRKSWKFNNGTTRKSFPADSIKQLIYNSHFNKNMFFIMIDLQKLQRALEHFIECVTLLALVISQLFSRCFYEIFAEIF